MVLCLSVRLVTLRKSASNFKKKLSNFLCLLTPFLSPNFLQVCQQRGKSIYLMTLDPLCQMLGKTLLRQSQCKTQQ